LWLIWKKQTKKKQKNNEQTFNESKKQKPHPKKKHPHKFDDPLKHLVYRYLILYYKYLNIFSLITLLQISYWKKKKVNEN
jgi:hypothetical protein